VYPDVDSVVWRSSERAPALQRVLAFDAESGVLAVLDARGVPTRLDLRLGTVRPAGKAPLDPVVADGAVFYGVGGDGAITRLTPSGEEWKVRVAGPVQALVPQRDGSVLAAGARGGTGWIWALRPPVQRVGDSTAVPGGGRALRTGTADRVYFAAGEELLGVRARDRQPGAPIALAAPIRSAVSTPSGDRLYVLTDRAGELAVVDRYAERVANGIVLPGPVRELRMDPLGRYLLARPERGDSAWIVAVGTDRLVGAVRGSWRDDLPLVLPDGAVATVRGADVVLADAATLQDRRTVAGGAGDLWHLVSWNGFRPRSAELDRPASFGGGERAPTTAVDSVAPVDGAAPADTATVPEPEPAPAESTTAPVRPSVPPPTASAAVRPPRRVAAESAGEVAQVRDPQPRAEQQPRRGDTGARRPAGSRGFTVQFAAVPSEGEARQALTGLRLTGPAPRVVPATKNGATFYRVVSGPYPSRAAAEQAARATGRSHWIYVGAP
jgi:cell division septation protein DedD